MLVEVIEFTHTGIIRTLLYGWSFTLQYISGNLCYMIHLFQEVIKRRACWERSTVVTSRPHGFVFIVRLKSTWLSGT